MEVEVRKRKKKTGKKLTRQFIFIQCMKVVWEMMSKE
jgi:hypothetical protein